LLLKQPLLPVLFLQLLLFNPFNNGLLFDLLELPCLVFLFLFLGRMQPLILILELIEPFFVEADFE
jgi:hypothetical protein